MKHALIALFAASLAACCMLVVTTHVDRLTVAGVVIAIAAVECFMDLREWLYR